jgi:hypothetical protein
VDYVRDLAAEKSHSARRTTILLHDERDGPQYNTYVIYGPRLIRFLEKNILTHCIQIFCLHDYEGVRNFVLQLTFEMRTSVLYLKYQKLLVHMNCFFSL